MQDEDRRQLLRLRKALRLHLVSDNRVIIPALGERGTGADEFEIDGAPKLWMVVYVERGVRRPIARFELVSDATKFVFWTMTASNPLNFQLEQCEPKPY